MDAQLKRVILTICILKLLLDGDKHGYVLVKSMQEYFPDTEESTLYSIFRRLNGDGYNSIFEKIFATGRLKIQAGSAVMMAERPEFLHSAIYFSEMMLTIT